MHIVVNTALATRLSKDSDTQRAIVLGGIVPDLDVFLAWTTGFTHPLI